MTLLRELLVMPNLATIDLHILFFFMTHGLGSCFQAGALEKLEAFASCNGPDFYRLPRNTSTITLEKVSMNVPFEYSFGSGKVVPMCAGETLEWSIASSSV